MIYNDPETTSRQISQLLLTSGHADYTRARILIRQLVDLSATSGNSNARNGGIMGLAGAASVSSSQALPSNLTISYPESPWVSGTS